MDPRVRTFATDVLNGDVALHEAWRRTFETLSEHGTDLVPIARRLAGSHTGERLRSEAGFGAIVLWNGPYDSTAYEQMHLGIGKNHEGFNVTLSQGVGRTIEGHLGLTEADAEKTAIELMDRLI